MNIVKRLLFLGAIFIIFQFATPAFAIDDSDFVYIPPGTFTMGDDSDDKGDNDEHEVRITEGFLMYRHEVTQREWFEVMGTRPWLDDDLVPKSNVHDHAAGSDKEEIYPVTHVSWNDINEFLEALNDSIYKLPTEAQWEYACRAGTDTHFSFGDYNTQDAGLSDLLDRNMWFYTNTAQESYAHPVAQKLSNPWGLYDMHGNVWEVCRDFYVSTYPETVDDPIGPTTGNCAIQRGGAFNNWAYLALGSDCTSANRNCRSPQSPIPEYNNRYDQGFRIIKVLSAAEDSDGDDHMDNVDNCPLTANNDQEDTDHDGIGDACDTCPDNDEDTFCGGNDNCPDIPNSDQADADEDGIGDACDECTDSDGDGYGNPGYDNPGCPIDDVCENGDDAVDIDGDSIPDACDSCIDRDGDGYGEPDAATNTCDDDNCPDISNPGQEDEDNDGVGDACEPIGDYNGDNMVDLTDIVLLLKILAGIEIPAPGFNADNDSTGDDRVALGDAIYVLQKVAGVRQGI